jgi:hypothetical protein
MKKLLNYVKVSVNEEGDHQENQIRMFTLGEVF